LSKAPDLSRFGEISVEPKFLFPYVPTTTGKFAHVPYPKYPDPTGSGKAAIEFLSHFTMPEGRAYGQPVDQALAPFQTRAIMALFGHRDPVTQTRYFRSADFICPRKNAKTFLAAVLALLFLFSGQEKNNEILVAATGQKQARRTLKLLIGLLRSNEARFAETRIQEHLGVITHIPTSNTVTATVADGSKILGSSPGCVIGDELLAWDGERGHALWQSLITGMGARKNPLAITTTTVPDKPTPADSVFSERLRYSLEVMKGERKDARHLPMVWLTGDDDDISDPAVWKKANPGLGYSLDLDELAEEYDRAKAASERSLQGFATLRLNRIPKTSLDLAWLSADAVARTRVEVDFGDFNQCLYTCGGLDLGGAWDFATFCITGQMPDGSVITRQQSYLCNSGYQRDRNKVPLDDFIERGELHIQGDDAVPTEDLVGELLDWCNSAGVSELAIDPAMSTIVAPALEAGGLEVIYARQGTMSMSAPMHLVETLINDGKLAIGDDALFQWCLNNTGVVSNSTGRKPCKIGNDSSSNPNKVDATSALLTSLQLLQEARGNSMVSATKENFIMINPYTDPMDWVAVSQGGTAAFAMMFTEAVEPNTGAIILQAI
jgi:phage terminase large subunit-like protein